MITSIITGTGSCIPQSRIANKAFEAHEFFDQDGNRLYKNNSDVISKFTSITGIEERRYARPDQVASDLGLIAAETAIEDAGLDRETIDYVIVAHNFGDVWAESNRVTMVPALASVIKGKLRIKNADCVAYDIVFGCPGWIEGVIQANLLITSGQAKRCLIIGTETLSRVIDPHDRDSMIYGDGAGAVVVEASTSGKGILSHKTRTFATGHNEHLTMANSNAAHSRDPDNKYLKMNGRRVYEFALNYVPLTIRAALDKINLSVTDISKVLIHQANEKMDHAILERLFKDYSAAVPEGIMPMTIAQLGNSSVATVPTLLDLLLKRQLENHAVQENDKIIMASVGAGMNINALVYQF